MASGSDPHVGMRHGPGVFTQEEFEKAARQVVSPDISEFEYFIESHGTKFYRKYREETGLYEYKIHGIMDDMDPELCAQVYVDWEYRKKWDSYVLDLHPVTDAGDKVEGLYWCVDYPWPMSDRDYTFIRDMKVLDLDGEKTWVVLAKYRSFSNIPEKDGIIRVDQFQQACVMQSDGKVGAKAYMYYYDNPKGMIPTWLINWAAKTGVPQFLDMMRKAVFAYKDFLEERRKELGWETMNNEERLRTLYSTEPTPS